MLTKDLHNMQWKNKNTNLDSELMDTLIFQKIPLQQDIHYPTDSYLINY